jgi:hypothetical protein
MVNTFKSGRPLLTAQHSRICLYLFLLFSLPLAVHSAGAAKAGTAKPAAKQEVPKPAAAKATTSTEKATVAKPAAKATKGL